MLKSNSSYSVHQFINGLINRQVGLVHNKFQDLLFTSVIYQDKNIESQGPCNSGFGEKKSLVYILLPTKRLGNDSKNAAH